MKVFTDSEKRKLEEFRTKVSDILQKYPERDDDYYLIRWLRARNLDIPKAEEMLRTSTKWREDNKVDGILERESEVVPEWVVKSFPSAFFGEDSEGNPIVFLPLGRFDHRTALEKYGMEKFFRYNLCWCEEVMKRVENMEKQSGKKGLHIIQLVDFEHYSYRELTNKPSRDFIIETQKVMEANYPEMLKKVIIINAPKIFALVFKIVKPLLPKETLEKMDVYGQNEEEWKSLIRETYPEALHRIPIRWGGTLQGSDPFCSQDTTLWMDGPIPLAYFTNDEADQDGLTKVKVKARDALTLPFKVAEKGSKLSWRFHSIDHDIGFAVKSPDGKFPVPLSRKDSHKSLQEGYLSCEFVGDYHLIFDNTFSYTKGKVVLYSAEIIVPDGKENK